MNAITFSRRVHFGHVHSWLDGTLVAPASAPPPYPVVSWKYNVNGLWSNAADWTGGVLPGAGNDVLLDTLSARTITFATGASAIEDLTAVTDTLNVTGGDLTVNALASFGAGLGLIGANGELDLLGASASVAGTFTETGGYMTLGAATTLTMSGTSNIGAANLSYFGEIDGGVLLNTGVTNISYSLNNNYYGLYLGGVSWINAGTFNDNGTIFVDADSTANFVNNAGATLNFTTSGGILNGSGASSSFSNAGTLLAANSSATGTIDANFTNTALIDLAGGNIQFNGGGVFGGTITGTGEIAFGGGSATLTAGSNFTVANWTIDGAYLYMSTALNYAGNLAITGGTLTLDGTSDAVTGSFYQYGGALDLNGSALALSNATLGGNGALEGPGTLTTSGTTTLSGASLYYLGGGVTWINQGTIDQNIQIYNDTNTPGIISIVNEANASWAMNINGSLDANGNGTDNFTNFGSFVFADSYAYIDAYFTSSGVIDAASGTIYFQDGGTFGGTLTGDGAIEFAGGAATLTANALYAAANLALSAGSLTLEADATPADGSFSQTGGSIYLNGNTLTLADSTLGAGYIEGAGSLLTSGTTSIAVSSNVWLGGNIAWTNTGTVNQYYNVYADPSSAGTFDLVNASSALYDMTGNYWFGYYNNDIPTLENAGTFEQTGGGLSYLAAFVANTGTLLSASGTLALYEGGMLGGTLTGAGTIAFENGFSTIAAGAVVNVANIIIDGGIVQLDENLTFAASQFNDAYGTIALNGNNLATTAASLGGNIDGPGTLTTAGATAVGNNLFLGGGMTWLNTGTVTQTANMYDDSSNPGGAAIINQAGAKYAFDLDGYLFNRGTVNDSFTNAGIFTKAGGSNIAYIDAYFTNTGTVSTSSNTGTIAFQSGGAFSGTINGSGTVEFISNTYALGGLGIAGATSVIGYNASFALSGNSSIAGNFTAEYYTSIALDGFTLALTGTNGFGTVSGYNGEVGLYGPGTMTTSGATTIADYYSYVKLIVAEGADWINSGTVADAGNIWDGDSAGGGTITNNASGVFDFTTDDASISATSFTGTFVNAGLLAKVGGSLTSHIYATLLDSGTLSSLVGTLELDAGGSLAGLIADKSNVVLNTNGIFTDGALIVGGGATVTNFVNIDAAGTLTLGDANTKAAAFVNDGIYDIVSIAAIVAGSSAADLFTNAGLLEQGAGSFRSVISANVANTGTILAGSGTLALTGSITGTGVLDIGAGATLELGANVGAAQAITFLSNSGTLMLDSPGTVKEKIAGFTVGTAIDLVNTIATSGTLSGNGTLVLYNGSTAVATLSLLGTHTGDVYSFTSDGHGGTLLNIVSNSTVWAAKTADWNTAADWNNGIPDGQSNVTVAGSNAYTLSLAAGETAYANNVTFSDAKALYDLYGTMDLSGTLSLTAGTMNFDGSLYGGTISATGGTLNFTDATWQNVTYVGALTLAATGESLEIASPLSMVGSGAGTVNLTGDNVTLYLDGVTAPNLTTLNIGNNTGYANLVSNDADGNGGVLILSAAINQVGSFAALADSNGAYDGIFNEGTLTANVAHGTFSILGTDFENDGTMLIGNGDTLNAQSGATVNAGTLNASGATLILNDFENDGLLNVNGGTLSLQGSFLNAGSITSTNTALDLGATLTTAQLVSLVGSGDTVDITTDGYIDNTGAALTIGTGSALGQLQLNGTIEGGTIIDNGNGLANTDDTPPYATGELSDVTYEGTLNLVTNMALVIAGSFTATGIGGTGPGVIDISAAGADLIFQNTRTIDNATIAVGNNAGEAYFEFGDTGGGATFTLGQHLTVTQSGALADFYFDDTNDIVVNEGSILANAAGTMTIGGQGGANGTFTNLGSIVVSGGDNFLLNTGIVFSNFAGTTLTGGSFEVDGNSVLELANNSTISALNAAVTLSGAGSAIEALNTTNNKQVTLDAKLNTIGAAGDLTLKNGRNFTTAAAFTDSGILQLGGTTFTASSLLTISSTGSLLGNGTVAGTIADAGAILANNAGTLLLAGAVSGAGALGANANATLELTQGQTLTELLSGAGTLLLAGGASYSVAPGVTETIATLAVSAGATLTGAGNFTGGFNDAGLMSVTTGTLAFAGAAAGAGTLNVAAGAVLDLAGGGAFAGAITGGGTLRLDGTSAFVLQAGGTLAVTTVTVDAGAILDLTVPTSLTGSIGGGGTLQLDGGTFTLSGATETIASLAVDAVAALSGFGTIAGLTIDAGTVMATGGTLALAGISGAGTLGATVNAVLDLTASSTLAERITGTGTLQLDNGTYTLAAGATPSIAYISIDAGASLSGTGTIASAVIDNGMIVANGGKLVLGGALSGGGALQASANAVLDLTAGGALANPISGAGTLELGGAYSLNGEALTIAAIAIDAGASLTGTGTVASAIVDTGTVSVAGGTLVLAGAVTGAGTLSAGASSVLDLTASSAFAGAITGAGTVRFDAAMTLNAGASLGVADLIATANLTLGTGENLTNLAGNQLALAASQGTVTLSGASGDSFTNAGTMLANGAGTEVVSVGFINSGIVMETAGALTFLGAVTNNGTISATGAVASFTAAVSGTGALDIGAGGAISLLAGAGAGQTVDFLGGTGLLDLTKPKTFSGTIAGFGAGSVIDLLKTPADSLTYKKGVLKILDGTKTEATLQFNGNYTAANFSLASDGHGGELVIFNQT
ncbi:MAG TPA: hypothetical protein VMB71_12790 [Acetobacteraceae bacterium]|nr:hypothetical protein [Acetobacteraceae bacterium]